VASRLHSPRCWRTIAAALKTPWWPDPPRWMAALLCPGSGALCRGVGEI